MDLEEPQRLDVGLLESGFEQAIDLGHEPRIPKRQAPPLGISKRRPIVALDGETRRVTRHAEKSEQDM